MTQETQSRITDEMRASIGRESPPQIHEVTSTGIRMFARAIGYTDLIHYDEAYAKSKGHRGLVAPPAFLGTTIFDPNNQPAGPGAPGPGGQRRLGMNGGNEFEYTGVEICAGDVLTSVSKTVSIDERRSSMGQMIITRRESVYTNQKGEVVCRAYGTGLQF